MADAHAAAMGALAVFCFWRWLQRSGVLETVAAGVVLGLAMLCKFTLLILFPLLPVLWAVYRLPERKTRSPKKWVWEGGMLIAMLAVGLYIINAGYLFEGTFTRLEEYRFQTTVLAGGQAMEEVPVGGGNRFAGTWLGKLPVPLPSSMVEGIDMQRYDFERGMPSYLRGRWADGGWAWYYLCALAIKVPLGTWCLAALAIVATVLCRGYRSSWRDEMVVLVPGMVILVFVSSQTGFSIHSRYVIPALPFLFVWISKIAKVFERCPSTRPRVALACSVVAALIWSVSSSLWAFPHNLAYFNELVGGPRNGGKHLLNSNIDWGQDLFHLAHWLDKHSDVKLTGLACYCSYPVTLADISETPLPPPMVRIDSSTATQSSLGAGPKPGWYAVSVNCLYGRSGQYRYFTRFRPAEMVGYSIRIYHITLAEANRLRRESGLRELPKHWTSDSVDLRDRETE